MATETASVIYNCKRCKVGRRVEYKKTVSFTGTHMGRTDENGKYFRAGVWITRCGPNCKTEYGGDPLGLCPSCGKMMKYGTLQAFTRPEVRCDARCTHARGFSCDCSCGGKNHGVDWSGVK